MYYFTMMCPGNVLFYSAVAGKLNILQCSSQVFYSAVAGKYDAWGGQTEKTAILPNRRKVIISGEGIKQ